MCKLLLLPFHWCWQMTGDFWVRDKGLYYHTTSSMHTIMFTSGTLLLLHEVSWELCKGVQMDACTHTRLHYTTGTCYFTARSQQAYSLSWSEILPHPSRLLTVNTILINGWGKQQSGSYILGIPIVWSWMVPPQYVYILAPKICVYYLIWIEGLWRLPVETVGRNRNVEAASGEFLKKEMRNMLLETGGKVILVISWQKIWTNCVL